MRKKISGNTPSNLKRIESGGDMARKNITTMCDHDANDAVLVQFEPWHGRPARESTRKMRVLQAN